MSKRRYEARMTQEGRADIYLAGKFQATAALDLEWFGHGEYPQGETVKDVFEDVKWINYRDFVSEDEDLRDASRWFVLPETFAPPAI